MKPTDIFEEIWVRDIVDLVWEALRLRRLKADLMTATAYMGLEQILKPLVGFLQEKDLAKAWAARDPSAIKRVDKLLASAGLTMDAVMAQTLSSNLDDFERIDRMIATAEVRRNTILREVDRHRATWGQALRRATQQVEEDEFKLIEVQPAKPWRDQRGQDKLKSCECARKHGSENRAGQNSLGVKRAPPRAQPARSCRSRSVGRS